MNYYEILQITPDASDEVIKAAYKALAKKYHPDNGAVDGTKKLQLLNEAYRVLSDSSRRKEYDHSLQITIDQVEPKKDTFSQNTDIPHPGSEEHRNDEYYSSVNATPKSKFGSAMQAFVRGVSQELQRNHQIEENAYYDALSMNNYDLIQAFKKNYGLKRNGYARVLEERGLLVRCDEKLVPTDEFKLYWR